MHVEHSAERKALPGEPSTRQMEHFLHHTQPPETRAQVGALSGALSYLCCVDFFMAKLVYYTEVCCWLCYIPPLP